MSKEPNKPSWSLSDQVKNLPAPLFWACLFFFCASDRIFNIPFHGFHFRAGQLLLALAALTAIPRVYAGLKAKPGKNDLIRPLLIAWIPFFALYGVSAALSAHPVLSFVKLAWGIFNIIGAALVVLTFSGNGNLFRGFQWTVLGIAVVLWIDSISLQCFGGPTLLGYSQPAGTFEGVRLFRPEALYYEPSFAGSALAFAAPLLLAASAARKDWPSLVPPAVVVSALVLTGSRTGLFCLFVSLITVCVICVAKKQTHFLARPAKSLLLALLLLGLFAATPGGGRYFRCFLKAYILPQKIYSNLTASAEPTSESDRFHRIASSIQQWEKNPLLGQGVVPDPGDPSSHLFKTTFVNTWSELAVESGLLGILAFIFAAGSNMRTALQNNRMGAPGLFITAAWFAHFTVNLNFTQTFPRLDYWLLFFFSIALLTSQKDQTLSPPPGS